MSRHSGRGVSSKLLSSLSPHSAAAEAYRLLRTNLRFASVDHPVRSVAVTSALPDDGKSLTASNLAITMAQAGARTLLVDADLRKPGLHKLFLIQNRGGLTSTIVGLQKVEDAVQPAAVDNLWVLAAGEKPPNPAEIIQSEAMHRVHRSLSGDFDFVVYDCPPVLPAVEAIDLSAMADGAILVVRAEVTPKDAVKQALDQIRAARASLLGVVLNGTKQSGGYGYQYYSYSYGS